MAAPAIGAGIEVEIRPWEAADAEELVAMYAGARDELTEDAPWRTPEWFTARGQRERIQRCRDDAGVEGFVITTAGAIAGDLSLDQMRRDILQSAGIGYWVAPWQRRRGVATRAIGLAVAHAFDQIGLHRIHATVAVDNLPSWRALERNGFHQVGIIKGFALVGGRWTDHHLYQLTAEDRLPPPPGRSG